MAPRITSNQPRYGLKSRDTRRSFPPTGWSLGRDDGLEVGIRGLKADAAVTLLEEGLERGLAIGEQGDDALAVARGAAALDDDVVAVEDALVAHRIARDPERKRRGLPRAGAEERLDVEFVGLLELFDGAAGRDASDEGERE